MKYQLLYVICDETLDHSHDLSTFLSDRKCRVQSHTLLFWFLFSFFFLLEGCLARWLIVMLIISLVHQRWQVLQYVKEDWCSPCIKYVPLDKLLKFVALHLSIELLLTEVSLLVRKTDLWKAYRQIMLAHIYLWVINALLWIPDDKHLVRLRIWCHKILS